MTIPTSASAITVAGNGSTPSFSFSFVGAATSDIFVSYIDSSGNLTSLNPSQYTISLNPATNNQLWGIGGVITYPLSGSPIPSGTYLTIQRILPLTQQVSIQNQGNFYPRVTEQALDLLEMQIQQVSARTGQVRGIWGSGIFYNYGDIVVDGANGNNTNNYYLCAIPNTSNVWSTDLAAGDWVLAFDTTTLRNLVIEAQTSATNAANSATAASGSATAAGTSATNAANSATAAAGSATDAQTSATNAANSATAASGSATAAGTSATNAANSATAAAGSASSAGTNANFYATSVGGTSTAITATTGCTGYSAGQRFYVSMLVANGANPTINFDGLGAKNLKKNSQAGKINVAPSGEWGANFNAELQYDGTDMVLLNPLPFQISLPVASAVSVNLATSTGFYQQMTGTTTITAFQLTLGDHRAIFYTGAGLNITLSATLQFGSQNSGTLVLNTGDYFEVQRDGTVFRIVNYTPASGVVTTGTAQSINGAKTFAAGALQATNLNGGPLAGFRNGLYNGCGQIAQRGTSFTNVINQYTLDRWYVFGGPGNIQINQIQQTSVSARNGYDIRFGRVSGSTQVNAIGFAQGLEARDSYRFSGRQITISFRAQAAGGFTASGGIVTLGLLGGTTEQNIGPLLGSVLGTQNFAITGGVASYSATFTVASNIVQVGLYISYVPVGTATATDFFDVADIQMEEGVIATPFEQRPWEMEQALCQRYYEKTFPYSVAPAQNVGSFLGALGSCISSNANSYTSVDWRYRAPKRVTPTVITYNPSATNVNFRNSGNTADYTASSANSSENGIQLFTSNVVAAGQYGLIHGSADAEL